MKTLKRNIFIKSLLLILVVAFLGSCKKSGGDDGDGNDIGSGKGTFTLKGTTYSGLCQSVPATSGVSGNIDVLIASQNGASFAVYNMPTGSGGTSNVVNFNDTDVAFSSQLYAISLVNQSTSYYSTSGTITKTGAKSYKFSVKMLDVLNDESITVTGSGNY